MVLFSHELRRICSDEIILPTLTVEGLRQENHFLLLTCVKSRARSHVQTQAPESALPWAGCSPAGQWK